MSWFATFFRRKSLEERLDKELRFHLESRIDDLVKAGRTREAARREAAVEFGSVEVAKEGCRDERRGHWLETLGQDVRYAARQLCKDKGFTATVLITLGLGIGGFTTIYSVVDGLLLHPRDYPALEQLVMVRESHPQSGLSGVTSIPIYRDWREQARSFDGMAALTQGGMNLTGEEEPLTVIAGFVSANFFDVLGVRPTLGRGFSAQEEIRGRDFAVVLSHSLWQAAFHGSPDVIGRTIQLNYEPYTVVGVAPAYMDQTLDARPLWTTRAPSDAERRGVRWTTVIARLKPGVTVAAAQTEMDAIASRLAAEYPEISGGWRVSVIPRINHVSQQWRAWLWTLLAAVGVLLLIVCANVANLQLVRASARQREMAVRAALGAGRLRLVRQLMTESFLLAMAGGMLGVLLALWGMDALRAAGPSLGLARLSQVEPNLRILWLAVGLTVATAFVFGLAPAWLASAIDVREAMSQSGRGNSEGRGRSRLRRLLVVAEVALALVLLAGAGLFVRSFLRLSQADLGFKPEQATSLWLQARRTKYVKAADLVAYYERVTDRILAIPGVEVAGYAKPLPLLGWPERQYSRVPIAGRPVVTPEDAPLAYVRTVGPGFLEAMGVPLLRGRTFGVQDTPRSPAVAVVSESFARQHFPGIDPIGQRLSPNQQIVGIVADAALARTDEVKGSQVYFLERQVAGGGSGGSMMIIVRTTGAPELFHPALVAAVRAEDPDVPVYQTLTLPQAVGNSSALRRFAVLLLTIFSAVALILAAVGLYGVMAYTVAQRRTEIGIRIALGGQVRDILALVMQDGARLVGTGGVLGLLLALGFGELIESRLFQTSARDPITLAGISLFFAVVAAAACFIPARRAVRVDPIIVLRADG